MAENRIKGVRLKPEASVEGHFTKADLHIFKPSLPPVWMCFISKTSRIFLQYTFAHSCANSSSLSVNMDLISCHGAIIYADDIELADL